MRTQQIFTAVYQKGLNDFEKFTTIPIDLRKELSKIFLLIIQKLLRHMNLLMEHLSF